MLRSKKKNRTWRMCFKALDIVLSCLGLLRFLLLDISILFFDVFLFAPRLRSWNFASWQERKKKIADFRKKKQLGFSAAAFLACVMACH